MASNGASAPASGGSFGFVAVTFALAGAVILGYGLLVVSSSALGGGWIAAIGISLVLAGVFRTAWAGDRWELPAGRRRALSRAFAVLAAVLLVLFVVVNF